MVLWYPKRDFAVEFSKHCFGVLSRLPSSSIADISAADASRTPCQLTPKQSIRSNGTAGYRKNTPAFRYLYPALPFSMPGKNIECKMQYAKNTRMLYYIWSHFAACILWLFWPTRTCHMCQGVWRKSKQSRESTNMGQLYRRMIDNQIGFEV